MRGVNLSELADLPNDATLVALVEIDPYEENGRRKRHRLRYADLLTALQDLESNYAGSGEPDRKVVGKKVYDTDDTLLKLYRSLLTTPKVVLDHVKAYAQDLATAGTETFKLGGAIDVNTVAQADAPITYSVPANTLDQNGKSVISTCFTQRVTQGADVKFGGTTIATNIIPSAAGMFLTRLIIARTSVSEVKYGLIVKFHLDTTGLTNMCFNGLLTKDLTSSQVISQGARGTIATTQMMLTKLLN